MRWPNGGPPKLWVVVINSMDNVKVGMRDGVGSVVTFERRDARKAWLMKHYPTYSSHDVTLLEYVQKEK